MNSARKSDIEKKLSTIPGHTVLERNYTFQNNGTASSFVPFTSTLCGKGKIETYPLYPGITLSIFDLLAKQASFRHAKHDSAMAIHYCHYGRIGWEMENNNTLYLGPGDLSLLPISHFPHSGMALPLGYYEGIAVVIDLKKLSSEPPELLHGTGITGELLQKKFCPDKTFATLPGGDQAKAIFRPLFDLPEHLRLPYFKLKVQELLLYLYQLPEDSWKLPTQYQTEQIDTIKAIHEQLMQNLDKRITIEALSRQYLMNPTTLKAVFKKIYGTSIAAHMKEHRMEKAAELLRDTENSVAQIAKAVGYESQSKFTTAFKDTYGVMPSIYRKTQTR